MSTEPDDDPVRLRLGDQPAAVVTAQDLLGEWPHRYRILHPARVTVAGQAMPRRWQQVADERGVAVDLARATWVDVSGSRLHRGEGADLEPVVGPAPEVLTPVLEALTACFRPGRIRVAEWCGYGSAQPGRELGGAVREPSLRIGGESHTVWELALPDLLDRIAGSDGTRDLGSDGVLADHIWDADGRWLLVADQDLASTYCGSIAPVRWPATVESVAIGPSSPLG